MRQNKTLQHENHNFSEMREYFCIKFYPFVQHIVQHDVRRNDRNLNLKNEFCYWTNVDFFFIKVALVGTSVWRQKPSDFYDF